MTRRDRLLMILALLNQAEFILAMHNIESEEEIEERLFHEAKHIFMSRRAAQKAAGEKVAPITIHVAPLAR